MRSTLTWIFVVAASIALGLLFDYFNVAAAWILAAILVAGGMALIHREELVLNSHVEKAGRGVIGVLAGLPLVGIGIGEVTDRKSTRLNSSHVAISYAVFCLIKKTLL